MLYIFVCLAIKFKSEFQRGGQEWSQRDKGSSQPWLSDGSLPCLLASFLHLDAACDCHGQNKRLTYQWLQNIKSLRNFPHLRSFTFTSCGLDLRTLPLIHLFMHFITRFHKFLKISFFFFDYIICLLFRISEKFLQDTWSHWKINFLLYIIAIPTVIDNL